jgi:hypothetical protein
MPTAPGYSPSCFPRSLCLCHISSRSFCSRMRSSASSMLPRAYSTEMALKASIVGMSMVGSLFGIVYPCLISEIPRRPHPRLARHHLWILLGPLPVMFVHNCANFCRAFLRHLTDDLPMAFLARSWRCICSVIVVMQSHDYAPFAGPNSSNATLRRICGMSGPSV